jgi:hypothetical protein
MSDARTWVRDSRTSRRSTWEQHNKEFNEAKRRTAAVVLKRQRKRKKTWGVPLPAEALVLYCFVHRRGAAMSANERHQVVSLPDEVLVKIFTYLSLRDFGSTSATCKQWNAVAWSLIIHVDFSRICHRVTDSILAVLGARAKALKSVNLSWCFRVTVAGIKSLPPTVTSISLYACTQLSSDLLAALPRGLLELDLSHNPNIRDEDMHCLPPGLQSLSLMNCARYVAANSHHNMLKVSFFFFF